MILRATSVAAAMLVVTVAAECVLHKEWFTGTSSPDEQQYIIQGHEVGTEVIARCIAEQGEDIHAICDIAMA